MEFNRNKDFNVNKASKVDLNSLIAKVKEEEKKQKDKILQFQQQHYLLLRFLV